MSTKSRLTITILLFAGLESHSQHRGQITDTLQWLKVNISQKSSHFKNKPLSILLDSLRDLKTGIYSYSGPAIYAVGLNDSIWVSHINLYFGDFHQAFATHSQYFGSGNDTINTHLKFVRVKFAWPVLFLRQWWFTEEKGRGSFLWNKLVESIYSQEWVFAVEVKEY